MRNGAQVVDAPTRRFLLLAARARERPQCTLAWALAKVHTLAWPGLGANHFRDSHTASSGSLKRPLDTYVGPLDTYQNTYILPKTLTRFSFFGDAGWIAPMASPWENVAAAAAARVEETAVACMDNFKSTSSASTL